VSDCLSGIHTGHGEQGVYQDC